MLVHFRQEFRLGPFCMGFSEVWNFVLATSGVFVSVLFDLKFIILRLGHWWSCLSCAGWKGSGKVRLRRNEFLLGTGSDRRWLTTTLVSRLYRSMTLVWWGQLTELSFLWKGAHNNRHRNIFFERLPYLKTLRSTRRLYRPPPLLLDRSCIVIIGVANTRFNHLSIPNVWLRFLLAQIVTLPYLHIIVKAL